MPNGTNNRTIISNLALSHIKQRNITSPDDASEAARKINLFYDRARRAALRACDWNFAKQNIALNLLGSVQDATFDPTFATPQDVVPGYSFCYSLPANCIRVQKLYTPISPDSLPLPYIDRTVFTRIEGFTDYEVKFELMRAPKSNVQAIVTNLQGAWAKYTFDITDESQFDDMFFEAFAYDLALRLCMPLTADKELLSAIKIERDEFVGEAKRKNGGEGTEMQKRSSAYEDSRN